MAHGGKRAGSGRKRGQVSKQTKMRVAVAEKALLSGLTPLDYMLEILRDATRDDKERFAAAKEAAPYIHPRLAAVEHSGNQDKPLTMLHEIVEDLDGMGRGLPHSAGVDTHETH